jgi:three-Cys-motif partner protein
MTGIALKFNDHTQEKLDAIDYYYKKWFNIVKGQKVYIIDTNAGTGYNEINGQKVKGSAILAVDLFKEDDHSNLKIFLINIDPEEISQLLENIVDYCAKEKISAKIDEEIFIIKDDWANAIHDILETTEDGIRLFLLDPYAIKSFPWEKVLPLIKKGVSEHGYKESGIEILMNWAWHAIRRKIAKNYSLEENYPEEIKKGIESDLVNVDRFFGSINWRKIAATYPKDIFRKKDREKIAKLRDDLVLAYTKSIFKYFKYVKIHPVHARKNTKDEYIKEKGAVKYFLIFASNYRDALDIIDEKFKKYRDQKIFPTLPASQETLLKWSPSIHKNKQQDYSTSTCLSERIREIEIELGDELYEKNKNIIKFLYERKNYDYGCFSFALHNRFEIDEGHYTIRFLIDNEIVSVRKKTAKKGFQGNYYYLSHPKLVDRAEYLFYNDTVYKFDNNHFTKF